MSIFRRACNTIKMKTQILKKIKEKKSLENIDDSIVQTYIDSYFEENPRELTKIKNPKSAAFKKTIKEVRNELNRVYGIFFIDDEFTFQSRTSTKEREKIYEKLYQDIFRTTGKPKKILDLACGHNPLSYSLMDAKPEFIVTELIKTDVDNLNKYFKKTKLNGKAIQENLQTQKDFPEADITFLFKIIDVLETVKNRDFTESLIKRLNSKAIVMSFSTRTLKGRIMNHPRRGWLERMLNRLDLKYEKLVYPSEIFYVIKKS
jgi:hypothetical protein